MIRKTSIFTRRAARRGSLRRGTSTIELALTGMILISVCFGTIEFGYYFFIKNTMEGAAREGCRAAIVGGAVESDVTAAVDATLSAAGLNTANFTVTTTPTDISTTTIGNNVTVDVTGTWSVVGNGFRPLQLIGGSKQLLGSSVMRKEG
jgi:Flp pilus assembly protein TadG